MPDGKLLTEAKVLHLSAEDDLNKTVLPRFVRCQGNPTKAIWVKGIKNSERFFDLQRDLDELKKKKAEDSEIEVVVIDPINAYIGQKVDTHKEHDVRTLLIPLAKFVKESGVTVIGVVHLNKATELDAIYRVTGSMAYVAQARAVWLIEEDKDDQELKHFVPVKISNAPKSGKGLDFRLGGQESLTFSVPDEEVTANQLLEQREPKNFKQREAEEFLRELFEGRSEVPAAEAEEKARMEGIRKSTLGIARKTLKIESIKVESAWIWRKSL